MLHILNLAKLQLSVIILGRPRLVYLVKITKPGVDRSGGGSGGDGSEVKSTSCSCRASGLGSVPSTQMAGYGHLLLYFQVFWRPLLASVVTRHVHGAQVYMQATFIHIK